MRGSKIISHSINIYNKFYNHKFCNLQFCDRFYILGGGCSGFCNQCIPCGDDQRCTGIACDCKAGQVIESGSEFAITCMDGKKFGK